jgi:uncharacterized repeat protein (TIGR01451 family)
MIGGNRSAPIALFLLALPASLAMPANLRADPTLIRARQFPAPEPPLAGSAGAPGALPRGAVEPATPVVAIRARVESVATPGRELEYRFLVDNTSQADAHHVRVRANLPANARYKTARPAPASQSASEISWDLGTLKARQHVEIVLVVEPTSGEDIVCAARVTFEHGQVVRTRIAKPALRVHTTGPERGKPYDTLTYVIEVTNTGAADAANVVLSAELPPGLDFADSNPSTTGTNPLTWNLKTLAPGERRTVEFKVIATKSGNYPLKATVSAAGIGPVEGNPGRVIVGEPKLDLLMTGPALRSLDRTATYALTVSNSSSVPLTGVVLSDDLYFTPELRSFIEFVAASDDGRLVGNDVRWSLGTLAPGSRRTVTVTMRAIRAGAFKNVATVRADRGLSARAFITTEFEMPTGLTLDIEKLPDPVAVGKETTITFRLRQHGGTASTGVGLTVTLPDELQYKTATGLSGGPQDGRTLSFQPLGEVAPGADTTYTVTAMALRAGVAKVKAVVRADPPPAGGKIEREEIVTILAESASPAPPAAPAAPPAK